MTRERGIGSLCLARFLSHRRTSEAEAEAVAEVSETREEAGATLTGETSERRGLGPRRRVTRRL